MNKKSIVINIDEIRDVFEKDCEENNEKFSEENFQKFLDFLEIDFYDWIKGNLRYFHQQQ